MNGSAPTEDGEYFEGLGNIKAASASAVQPPSSSKVEGGGSAGFTWSPAEEYSVDPEAKKRESARSGSLPSSRGGGNDEVQYHIAAVEGDSFDDSYYLIDTNPQFPVGLDVPGNRLLDVNALASKLATLEVTQMQHHDGRGSDGCASPGAVGLEVTGVNTGGNGFTEIALGGSKAHTVTVKVEQQGTAVAWEFSSEPKGLAFGLSFEDDIEGAQTEQVHVHCIRCTHTHTHMHAHTHTCTYTLCPCVPHTFNSCASQCHISNVLPCQQILPLRRCVSHKATLTGEYVAQKAGNYILRFDNCHSK